MANYSVPQYRLVFHRLDGSSFLLAGKTAQIMQMLIVRPHGLTPFDTWPLTTRLGSAIYQLRHRHNIAIVTEMEGHKGGLHARYRLMTSLRAGG